MSEIAARARQIGSVAIIDVMCPLKQCDITHLSQHIFINFDAIINVPSSDGIARTTTGEGLLQVSIAGKVFRMRLMPSTTVTCIMIKQNGVQRYTRYLQGAVKYSNNQKGACETIDHRRQPHGARVRQHCVA